jgi:hypothetical protein
MLLRLCFITAIGTTVAFGTLTLGASHAAAQSTCKPGFTFQTPKTCGARFCKPRCIKN